MDDREQIRSVKSGLSKLAFRYLAYYFAFAITSYLLTLIPGVSDGYGYLIAAILLFLCLLAIKTPSYFLRAFRCERKMTCGRLAIFIIAVIGGQGWYQFLIFLADIISGIFGSDITAIIGTNGQESYDLGLILYVCLAAPILEECVFRCWFLRSFLPDGKILAVFASALLFSLIHGNIVQILFAFTVGLLFGYVAVEYSFLWALWLHIFNNLILGNLLPNLLAKFPPLVGNSIRFLLYWLCLVTTVIYAYIKRWNLIRYLKQNQPSKSTVRAFFTSAGILIAIGLLLVLSLFRIIH